MSNNIITIYPYINCNFSQDTWNKFEINPCYYELPLFSLITNCSYELYHMEFYKNFPILFLDYTKYNDFNKLLINEITIRPTSHIVTKSTTHYITSIPYGRKIADMYIPISYLHNNINREKYECGECNIEYPKYKEDKIYLNSEPKLRIHINKWDNGQMIKEEIIIDYQMKKWGIFEPIDKKIIDATNSLYFFWDLSDFISIKVDEMDDIDQIYFTLKVAE